MSWMCEFSFFLKLFSLLCHKEPTLTGSKTAKQIGHNSLEEERNTFLLDLRRSSRTSHALSPGFPVQFLIDSPTQTISMFSCERTLVETGKSNIVYTMCINKTGMRSILVQLISRKSILDSG